MVNVDPASLFQPTLRGYLGYCVGFFVRYFLIAGSAYWILQIRWPARFLPYRVQKQFPTSASAVREITWTCLNTLCTGLSTLVLYWLIRDGWTRSYFTIDERGWPYLIFSAVVGVVGYDAWFYWQHRLLHTRWLLRHAHAIHHRSTNPTVFAAYAHHPIETFMGNLYFILFVLVVPVHPLAFAAFGGFLLLVSLVAHSGYEFFPPGFTRHPLTRWLGTSTHHNMHHRYFHWNFGIVFNFWDRVMGTNHPDYHATFDAVRKVSLATSSSWVAAER